MGQAKRRGTFEQRRSAAIERDGINREEARRIEVARISAMTEEERQHRRERQSIMDQAMGIALATGNVPYLINSALRIRK